MITEDFIKYNGRESLLLLALLFRTYTSRREFCFTFKHLYSQLGINRTQSNRTAAVNRAIQSLTGVSEEDKNKLIIVPYFVENGNYTVIRDQAVDKILSVKTRVDKYSLFNTYIIIKRFVNHKTSTAYPSIETISDIARVSSNNTILKYIEILEHIGLITVFRSEIYKMINGKRIRPNNEYRVLV